MTAPRLTGPPTAASWSEGYAAGLDDLQAKVEEWFCDVSLDDLRAVEFASEKAV